MSTLIILRGNSGSGKSTVAKALQRELGKDVLLIPQDVIRRDLLNTSDGENTTALPLLIKLLLYGSKNCEYVILEGILNSSWYKSLFESAINIFNDSIIAYYYDIPFEETVRRHKMKGKNLEFGKDDMLRWYKKNDLMTIIPEKVFNEDISVDEAVNIILKDIKNSIEHHRHYKNNG